MAYRYEQLQVGTHIEDLIVEVYKLTKGFPQDERFGLISQTRRSAMSVYLNLAEGSARNSGKDFSRFITIAHASLMETHAGLKIATRMGYLSGKEWKSIQPEFKTIWIMLCSLRNSQR